jgi:yersiniabactin nonribosomal peptide synthetase
MEPLDLEQMRGAIAAMLGERPAAVGDHDDLLRLGMDSIQVIRLASQWRRAGAEVSYAELIEYRTLAEWWDLVAARLTGPPAASEPAMDEVDHSAPFELATMQHAYWVGRSDGQVLGGVGAQYYCEFDGSDVDAQRLERAVRGVIARHAMLRVRFLDDGRQQIAASSRWPGVTVHDLCGLPVEEAQRRAEQVRARLSQRRMAAEDGEVLDVHLSLLPAGRTRLHLAIEMLVCDAQSFQVLLFELAMLYTGAGPVPPPPDYSFPRYLAGRAARRSSTWDRDREYWRARLPELPGAPQLPLAVDPASVASRHHVRRCHTISADDWKRLAESARTHSVLLSMVFVAAFAEIVGCWSTEPRFLLNMPFYDRDDVHPEVGRIVGDFTNLVLLAVDVGDERPFVERVRQLQQQFHADLAHASYTGADVMRDLVRGEHRGGSVSPVVFTSAINIGELFGQEFHRCFGETGYTMSTTPQVWLDCQVTVRGDGLFVNWDAVEELFDAGLLDGMFAAYVGLLDGLAGGAGWSAPVGPLVPAATTAVRDRVNATTCPVPDELLHDGFFQWAGREPDRTALCWGGSRWSYRRLADRALRVAALLASRGVEPGDAVGVTVRRGPEQVVAVLGVLAAGGIYVPVGVDQPQLRRERIHRSAAVRCVVTESIVDDIAGFAPLPSAVRVAPDDLAYVIYTSGSTGEPKGVEVTHRSAMNTVRDINERFGVGPSDRVLAISSLDFDLSVYDLFGLLSAGGAVVLVAEEDRREAAVWAELVDRHAVTLWNSVPALLDMALVAGRQRPGWADRLRLALVSGDWVGLDLRDRLREQSPDCRLVALGGATEAAIWSNAYEVAAVPADWRSVPYGFPLRNQRFRVVDGRGRDRPDWVAGELWIGGTGVARGYRNDPGRTAAQFVTVDGVRWYRTGDLGRYWPDGTLEFLGRRDAQVKVGGHRIELGEVTATLSAHPAVGRAVAVVAGERLRRLAALVTPAGQRPDPHQLREWCAQRLPGYMVPDRIVVADSTPLTANGKVDTGRVRALLADAGAAAFQPAVGPVEAALASLWAELIETQPIGRTDNFFTLGGDSLLATRLLARLRAAGIGGGQMRTLLARPVLADFASTLHLGDAPPPRPAVIPDLAHRHEPFPPTDVQRAYWVGRTDRFALGGIGSHWYWELDGAGVDVARLEAAWNRLVVRHEMLRAVFDDDGNQRILPSVPHARVEVAEVAPEAAETALQRLRDQMSHRVADPGRWPLVEIRAVRYGERVRLAFSFDYIVLDALSIVLVFSELGALYRDPRAQLPPAGMSFRDYLLSGGPDPQERQAAEEYWRARAAGLPPAPRLALAVDPARIVAPRFTRREAKLEPSQWAKLVAQARSHGLTPAAVLATAYAQVMVAWSAGDELTLNLTLFDRRDVHPEVNATLGDFTSLLLAAYRPRPGETFAAAAARYQQEIWAGMEHRAVSAIWVLRERARRSGRTDVAMPVVFTSALGLPAGLVDLDPAFGRPVWGLSQTPQVWLDCQVTERGGALYVNWDAVEELFGAGALDRMFAALVELLDRLVDGSAWPAPVAGLVSGDAPAGTPPIAAPVPVATAFQPPIGPVESTLAAVWADLLQLRRVGRSDNFFALGGDSILATQLVAEVRGRFGAAMSMRQLLAAPVLSELAGLVAAQTAADPDMVEEGVV